MRTRSGLLMGGALAVVCLAGQPASAAGPVEHTNDYASCHFEPGDIPGVDVSFTAKCVFVHLPSGDLQVVAKSRLPEGYALTTTFVGPLASCFGGTGRITATLSGQVQATCRIPAASL